MRRATRETASEILPWTRTIKLSVSDSWPVSGHSRSEEEVAALQLDEPNHNATVILPVARNAIQDESEGQPLRQEQDLPPSYEEAVKNQVSDRESHLVR